MNYPGVYSGVVHSWGIRDLYILYYRFGLYLLTTGGNSIVFFTILMVYPGKSGQLQFQNIYYSEAQDVLEPFRAVFSHVFFIRIRSGSGLQPARSEAIRPCNWSEHRHVYRKLERIHAKAHPWFTCGTWCSHPVRRRLAVITRCSTRMSIWIGWKAGCGAYCHKYALPLHWLRRQQIGLLNEIITWR